MTMRARAAPRCKFAVTPDGGRCRAGPATCGGEPDRGGGRPAEPPVPADRARGPTARPRSLPAAAAARGRRLRRRVARARRAPGPRVAVKRIAIARRRGRQRAEREAVAAARLQHPGIVALYESGRDDDAVYLVSELVRGADARRAARRRRAVGPRRRRVGIALCDALAHAHGRGVVHRDVKPRQRHRAPTAADGEASRSSPTSASRALAGDDSLTMTGDVVGTLAYMAPEQADGRRPRRAATSTRWRSCSTRRSPASTRSAAVAPPRRCAGWARAAVPPAPPS